MGKKVFDLVDVADIQGRPFRGPERDAEGNPVREKVLDEKGEPVMQVPRNAKGEPIPNVQPEPVYRVKTRVLGTESLPEILKGFFLNIPPERLTRQDTIYGTRMYQSLAAIKNGTMELDDDVYDWIKHKLQEKTKNTEGIEQELGIKIFGVDLYVVEQALENYKRPNQGKEAEAAEAKGD